MIRNRLLQKAAQLSLLQKRSTMEAGPDECVCPYAF